MLQNKLFLKKCTSPNIRYKSIQHSFSTPITDKVRFSKERSHHLVNDILLVK